MVINPSVTLSTPLRGQLPPDKELAFEAVQRLRSVRFEMFKTLFK